MKKKTPTYELTPRRKSKSSPTFMEWVMGGIAALIGIVGFILVCLFYIICALLPVALCVALIVWIYQQF